MTGMYKKNFQNCRYRDEIILFFARGTKDFAIDVSSDCRTWQRAVTSTLPNGRYLNCDVPTIQFPVAKFGRYIRFTAINYYGYGAGLNYLGWNKNPEPRSK